MKKDIPIEVIRQFIGEVSYRTYPIGDGHINSTFVVEADRRKLVIQKLNTTIFQQPGDVMANIVQVTQHLSQSDYALPLLQPLTTRSGEYYALGEGHYYRAFPLFENITVINKTPDVEIAFKASRAFAEFTEALFDLPSGKLRITIPGFHDFSGRVQFLEQSIESDLKRRRSGAEDEIRQLQEHRGLVPEILNLDLPDRVLHSDPKINNILFTRELEPLCIIDLDTLMPGPLFYDFSDMIRSYCNTADEDESNLGLVGASRDVLTAVIRGYLGTLGKGLTEGEWQSMIRGYALATYIQAVRFLSDYLNGDTYYQTAYPDHNLVRTRNQIKLLHELVAFEDEVIREIDQIRRQY